MRNIPGSNARQGYRLTSLLPPAFSTGCSSLSMRLDLIPRVSCLTGDGRASCICTVACTRPGELCRWWVQIPTVGTLNPSS